MRKNETVMRDTFTKLQEHILYFISKVLPRNTISLYITRCCGRRINIPLSYYHVKRYTSLITD